MIGFKDLLRLRNIFDFKLAIENLFGDIRRTIEKYKKATLHEVFKEKVFTSIGHKIEDRRINPKLLEECEKFIDNLYKYINYEYCEEIDNYIYKMGLIITVNEQKDARRFGSYWYYTKKEKILDKLFFIDEEPSIMEIKDYFGCEREERPEQLEILGEKTIEILEKCKRNMEKILYSARVLDKKTKSIGIIGIIFDNDNLSAMLHRLEILYALHNIFFEKLKTVRKKTGQYILVGCLGNFVFSEYNFQKREDKNGDIYYISE